MSGVSHLIGGLWKKKLCAPVRGKDWYALAAARRWNTINNELYNAIPMAVSVLSGEVYYLWLSFWGCNKRSSVSGDPSKEDLETKEGLKQLSLIILSFWLPISYLELQTWPPTWWVGQPAKSKIGFSIEQGSWCVWCYQVMDLIPESSAAWTDSACMGDLITATLSTVPTSVFGNECMEVSWMVLISSLSVFSLWGGIRCFHWKR